MGQTGSIAVFVICAVLSVTAARAQGRGNANWTTIGYDAQRSFWVRTDAKISSDSLRKPGFQLLWKIGLEGQPTPMVALDPYTGYRGHKSLGFLSGGNDDIYGIDLDLGIVEWHNRLSTGLRQPACSATSSLARPANTAIQPAPSGRGAVRGAPALGAVGEPGRGAVILQSVAPASAPPRAQAASGPAVVRPNAVYAVTRDGMLQTMFVSNGADAEPPVKFLPPNAGAAGLIVVDNVAYAETTEGCGGTPNGLWALDLTSKQVTWNMDFGGVSGTAGPAFGPSGTLYVTAGNSGTLAALEPKNLTLKNWFTASKDEFTSSPVVFQFGDKILLAAGTRNGSVFLLDSATMGGAGHDIPLDKIDAGVRSTLASWQDSAGARWILGAAGNAIVAWRVVDKDGPKLQSAWVSQDMVLPLTPIIVNGVIFVAARGEHSGAVLYALDGATGKQLWNSGATITSSLQGGGLSAAGSQIYLGTSDGSLSAFGFPMEH